MLLDEIHRASRAKQLVTRFFIQEASWNPLGAGATTPMNITTDSDSDFVLRAVSLCAYTAVGNFLPNPDYLVSFNDSGSGRNLQSAPIHVRNVTGDGMWPHYLVDPLLLKGGGTLTITLQNLTAVAARVEMSLHGFKLFYVSPFNRDKLGAY